MRPSVSLGAVLLAASACGGSKTDVHSRNGPTPFAGISAEFFRSQGSISGPIFQGLYVGVYELPPRCPAPEGWTVPSTHDTVTIGIVRPGTVPVGLGRWSASLNTVDFVDGAFAQYQKWMEGQLVRLVQAVSGSIELTRADDVTAEGDIAVELEDGTQLEGHFLASSECLR